MLYAALHLLDHQLIDRDGRLCGNVDDLELSIDEDGHGVRESPWSAGRARCGTGFDRRRLGGWLRGHVRETFIGLPTTDPGPHPDATGVATSAAQRAPQRRLSAELATFAAEHWVRDHVIGHIPGSTPRC